MVEDVSRLLISIKLNLIGRLAQHLD